MPSDQMGEVTDRAQAPPLLRPAADRQQKHEIVECESPAGTVIALLDNRSPPQRLQVDVERSAPRHDGPVWLDADLVGGADVAVAHSEASEGGILSRREAPSGLDPAIAARLQCLAERAEVRGTHED